MANPNGDDGVFVYRSVVSHPGIFKDDVMSYVADSYYWGTLMNYGSVWLDRTFGISLLWVSGVLVFWMRFAMPFFFVLLLRRHLVVGWDFSLIHI
ncbi:hypothetical protein C2W62_50035, partial [Candidatus Entotheonella serta]